MRQVSISFTIALSVAFALTVVTAQLVHAQPYIVIHNFSGPDGSSPEGGLTMDAAGNLYGTTLTGGANGFGSVFKVFQAKSGFVLNPLYNFQGMGHHDGAGPWAKLVFDKNGILYGTTTSGGAKPQGCAINGYQGCGTVFSLKPSAGIPASSLPPWKETVLYRFQSMGADGKYPFGPVVFDPAGNLYGTTENGGNTGNDAGTVYELMPSGRGWTESILYTFTGGLNGENPFDGLVFDKAGNLYGTAQLSGGHGHGLVFKMTNTGSGWTWNPIYDFRGESDGAQPLGGLIFDQSGNLYGTTSCGGSSGGRTVFELTPAGGGGWTFTLLTSFTGPCGGGPSDALVMDVYGNLYGTTKLGGYYGEGFVFQLEFASGRWYSVDLYDFICDTGCEPVGGVLLDSQQQGDWLLGTASMGGANGQGVVWIFCNICGAPI